MRFRLVTLSFSTTHITLTMDFSFVAFNIFIIGIQIEEYIERTMLTLLVMCVLRIVRKFLYLQIYYKNKWHKDLSPRALQTLHIYIYCNFVLLNLCVFYFYFFFRVQFITFLGIIVIANGILFNYDMFYEQKEKKTRCMTM